MTEEEKNMRILDAQEHPEHYTDKETDDMLEGIRELSDLKRAIADEDAQRENVDTDNKWKGFEARLQLKGDTRGNRRQLPKIAASVVGILFAGIAVYAASIGLGIVGNPFSYQAEETQAPVSKASQPTTEKATSIKDSLPVTEHKETKVSPKVISFDNEELGNILSQMAVYYKVKVNYGNDAVRHIRLHFNWNQAKTLDDVITLLNSFKQINIIREGNVLTVND